MTWYRTGTVTLTNGTPNIVGAGTGWLGAQVAAGDAMTLPDGRDYEIQAVGGDTSITLTTPYLGASVAGAVYQIKPIATAARLVDLSKQLSALVLTYADIAKSAGLGKFAKGLVVDNVMRPALRGLADDDTGFNFPGNNVIEQWQDGVNTANCAADGTPSGLMWTKAPISAAAAAAFGLKAYRGTPAGTVNVVEKDGWYCIGTVALNQSNTAKITVLGTVGYDDSEMASGETVIHLRGTNDRNGKGITGHFYGTTQGNATITDVAVERFGNTYQYKVYVRAAQYASISALCDTSQLFVPESTFVTVNAAPPVGAIKLPSRFKVNVSGQTRLTVDAQGAEVTALKQGPLALRTAKKQLPPGKVAATAGQTAQIPLGMSADLVVGLQVLVRYDDSGSCIGPNADGPTLPASYYRYRVWLGPSVLNVHVDAGEGSALLDRPFRAWIEYIVEE